MIHSEYVFHRLSVPQNNLSSSSTTSLYHRHQSVGFPEAVARGVFLKKVALKNVAKFTRKQLYCGLFFNKVAGLRPATLLKKRLQNNCFPINFGLFLKTTVFHRIPPIAAFDLQLICA